MELQFGETSRLCDRGSTQGPQGGSGGTRGGQK